MMGEELLESGALIGFCLIIGAGLGMLSSFIGLGAGALLAPVLYFTFLALDFGSPAHMAIGTSAAVIALISAAGLKLRLSLGVVDMARLKRSAPWLGLGAAIGTVGAALFTDAFLTGAIGAIVFVSALLILFAEGPETAAARRRRESEGPGLKPGAPLDATLGALAGAATAAAGLGGGAFAAIYYRAEGATAAQSNADATGAGLIIACIASVGAILFGLLGRGAGAPFSLGYVNLVAAAVIAPMILATAPLGARMRLPFGQRALRLVFAFVIAMVALTMVRRAGLA